MQPTEPANNQVPPEQPQHDGLMRVDQGNRSEGIKIQHFAMERKGIALNEILLEVEFKTSTFAVAAMLKGLNEFYFKPANMQGDQDIVTKSEHNLKLWADINQKAQSKIIIP